MNTRFNLSTADCREVLWPMHEQFTYAKSKSGVVHIERHPGLAYCTVFTERVVEATPNVCGNCARNLARERAAAQALRQRSEPMVSEP